MTLVSLGKSKGSVSLIIVMAKKIFCANYWFIPLIWNVILKYVFYVHRLLFPLILSAHLCYVLLPFLPLCSPLSILIVALCVPDVPQEACFCCHLLLGARKNAQKAPICCTELRTWHVQLNQARELIGNDSCVLAREHATYLYHICIAH